MFWITEGTEHGTKWASSLIKHGVQPSPFQMATQRNWYFPLIPNAIPDHLVSIVDSSVPPLSEAEP